jgi:hypothetical protein
MSKVASTEELTAFRKSVFEEFSEEELATMHG